MQVCGVACFSHVYHEYTFLLEMPEPLSVLIIAFCYGHAGLIVHDFATKFIVYFIWSPGSCRRKSLGLTRKSDLKAQSLVLFNLSRGGSLSIMGSEVFSDCPPTWFGGFRCFLNLMEGGK